MVRREEAASSTTLSAVTVDNNNDGGSQSVVISMEMEEHHQGQDEQTVQEIVDPPDQSANNLQRFMDDVQRINVISSSLNSILTSSDEGQFDSTAGNQSVHFDIPSSLQSSYPTEESGAQEYDDDLDSMPLPDSNSVLIINQAYQEVMEKVIEQVESALSNVRRQQKIIQSSLSGAEAGDAAHKHNKVPVLLYMPPYFKDFSNMAPPPNKDTIDKKTRGEYDPLVQPAKRWTRQECEKLKKAVREGVISEKTRSFVNRKEIVADKKLQLQCSTNDSKAIKKFAEELNVLDQKIRGVRNQSAEDLFEEACDIDWLSIANSVFLGTREPMECQLKWEQDLHPRWNRESKWSQDEEKKLRFLVETKGMTNWEDIASALKTRRTAFQVFEHYQCKMNTSLMKGAWTREEDEKLTAIVSTLKVGNHIPWEQVSYYMEGRTRIQVQTRWTRTLDPKVRRGRWTEEEDLLLMLAVQKFGARDWQKVAGGVPGRTDAQCRERWCSTLDSSVKMGSWTQAEDDILDFGVRQFGQGEWAKVSKLLIGRPPGACKQRYKSLQKDRESMPGKKRKRTLSSGEDPDYEPKKKLREQNNEDSNRQVFDANFMRLEGIKQRKERVREKFRELAGEDMEPLMPTGEDAVEVYLDSIRDDAVRRLIRSKLTSIHSRYSEKNEWHGAGYVRPPPKRRKVTVVTLDDSTELKERKQMEAKLKEAAMRIKREERAKKLKVKRQNIELMTKGLYRDMLDHAGSQDSDYCFPPCGCALEAVGNLLERKTELAQSAAQLQINGQEEQTQLVDTWMQADPPGSEKEPSKYLPDAIVGKIWSKGRFLEFRNRFNAIFHWPMVLNDIPTTSDHKEHE